MALVEDLRPALELVSPYCDIEDRLTLVPPSAAVRGLYLGALPKLLAQEGKRELYDSYFGGERISGVRRYPLRDYLVRLAVAGASLCGPEQLHQGINKLWQTNAVTFTESPMGRVMLRLLSRDPLRVSEQGLAARRQMFFYGHWEIVRHGPRHIEMVYREEYIWIESAMAGGAIGTFVACGVEASVETKLVDRFNGSTIITW